MLFSQAQLRDLLALLRTHDLIVLAGDSGSGKTSLVRGVAEAIGGVCTVVPVKPNWTGPEDLLGYYNPIERRFLPTPFLKALLDAARAPQVLHLIVLDEMNLARVEHYFADFLSRLEERAFAR
jgi:5-methylcytosine-specific restriction endonuclease McrBC GTP-binding regulatory subunit McrB